MTEKLLNIFGIIVIASVIGAAVGAGYAVWRVIDAMRQAISIVFGPNFYLYAALFSVVMMALVIIGAVFSLIRYMLSRSGRVYSRGGMFPLVPSNQKFINYNEAGSQTLAAIAGVGRLNAATARNVVAAQYRQESQVPQVFSQLPADDEPPTLTADAIIKEADPRITPHWLLVGSTGSGKTSATYSILKNLSRSALCEFLITEPGGVNWGRQAIATTTMEIAEVIIEARREMERRQELLRAEDVDHIERLRNPLKYLVLLVEETDALLDDLRLFSVERKREMLISLRAIARMGRKAGVCLVAVSQSGTTDVFDPHLRKNIGNVLIFRSEHTVSDMWRLGSGVKLSGLSVGTAYSVQHGATVQFPLTERPLLLAPGQWSDPNSQCRDEVPEYRNTRVPRADIHVVPPVINTVPRNEVPTFSSDVGTEYTPEQEAYIRWLYSRFGSLKAVQRELYGDTSEGGYWFYRIRYVVFGTAIPN